MSSNPPPSFLLSFERLADVLKATSISLVEPVGEEEEEERFWDCLEQVDSLGLEAKSMEEMVAGSKMIFEEEGFWTGASGGRTTGRKEGSHLTGS